MPPARTFLMTDPDDRVTGRRYLTREQYVDDRNLAARQSIYAYQQPFVDLHALVLDLAGLDGDERVFDVGCGNGAYLRALRARCHRGDVLGLDLSVGMIAAARDSADGVVNADVQAVPVRDAAMDVVLAPHMLYHVPDMAAGVAELRRVLRPGGRALVVTNSVEHLRELDALILASVETVTGERPEPLLGEAIRFKVENGEDVLRTAFADIELHRVGSELVLDDSEPVVAYAASTRLLIGGEPHADAVLADLRQRTQRAITDQGELRIRTAVGCFVCS
jgi:ubiquinone/menaquinone biosynthesis C-methylase UbiE